jgi:hypothetical protein
MLRVYTAYIRTCVLFDVHFDPARRTMDKATALSQGSSEVVSEVYTYGQRTTVVRVTCSIIAPSLTVSPMVTHITVQL